MIRAWIYELPTADLALCLFGQVQDLVCHLVESGVWDHTETVSRLETARLLPDRANAFQQRWLKQLEQRLAALA